MSSQLCPGFLLNASNKMHSRRPLPLYGRKQAGARKIRIRITIMFFIIQTVPATACPPALLLCLLLPAHPPLASACYCLHTRPWTQPATACYCLLLPALASACYCLRTRPGLCLLLPATACAPAPGLCLLLPATACPPAPGLCLFPAPSFVHLFHAVPSPTQFLRSRTPSTWGGTGTGQAWGGGGRVPGGVTIMKIDNDTSYYYYYYHSSSSPLIIIVVKEIGRAHV